MKVAGVPAGVVTALSAAQAEQVPCPVIATLTKQGLLEADKDGMVELSQLRDVLKQIGLSFAAREVLVRGTKGVEEERLKKAGQLVAGMEITAFDVTKLNQTTLMHTGDLKIRRDGFKQERLDWLFGFSSDGKGLTLKDLANAQEAAVNADPGRRGHVVGMAELSALIRLFGSPNAAGDKALSKEALTKLFRDNEFPDGWAPKSLGLGHVMANMARIAFHQLFTTSGRSAAGLDKALERQSPIDQSGVTSLGKAICPVGMRPAVPPVNAAELSAAHTRG